MRLRDKVHDYHGEVELEDRSLLVMGRGVQSRFEHSVPKTALHVGPRINLTFRKVAA